MEFRETEKANSKTTVPIRPASSLLVLRQASDGVEVLLLKRSENLRFLPGFLSYPGGSLDPQDYELAEVGVVGNIQAASLQDDRAFGVAALRECAEETGLVLCVRNSGAEQGVARPVSLSEAEQSLLLQDPLQFSRWLRQNRLYVDASGLRFVGRWITPPNMPVRFDTRFFVTFAGQESLAVKVHDAESAWGRWYDPKTVLRQIETGQAKAAPPTVAMLRGMAAFDNAWVCSQQLSVPGPDPRELIEQAEKLKRL